MRYIKMYEELSKGLEKIDDIQSLSDACFLPLIDDDFIIKVYKNNMYINIIIYKKNKSSFFHYEIYDKIINFINFVDYEVNYFNVSNSVTVDDILIRKFYKKKFKTNNGFYNNGNTSEFIRIDFNNRNNYINIIF